MQFMIISKYFSIFAGKDVKTLYQWKTLEEMPKTEISK